MKKRFLIISLMLIAVLVLSSCSGKNKGYDIQPEEIKIQQICELATLECYYHNVAISTKEAGTGILHIGEKARNFWIEYMGTAKIGINMSDVKIEIAKNNVTVYIPDAELLSTSVDSSTMNFYVEDDKGINPNYITADDQTKAISIAEENMVETVMADEAIFLKAKENAKELIRNYINQLGEACGKKYNITFVDVKNVTQ